MKCHNTIVGVAQLYYKVKMPSILIPYGQNSKKRDIYSSEPKFLYKFRWLYVVMYFKFKVQILLLARVMNF